MKLIPVFRKFSRLPLRGLAAGRLATTLLALAALVAVSAAPSVADAKRLGGGSSLGRQSSNMTPRTASPSTATPPAATPYSAAPAASSSASSATPAKPAAASSTASSAPAAAPARSGASRWFGPIAGIAAGLGLGALLSHLGLSGAFAEFLSSALLIAVVVFAVLFILRRLFGTAPRAALQGAGSPVGGSSENPLLRKADIPVVAPASAPRAATPVTAPAEQTVSADQVEQLTQAQTDQAMQAQSGNWFIPSDFDTPRFLQQAKTQFVNIQSLWDTGDVGRLSEFLTDGLITELKPQLAERASTTDKTEVLMLNAEMLGIETVPDGHLASVRFSGMLRESRGAEASRFEEVWNLFKPEQGGWLLAGIQQIPVAQTN